MTGILLSFGPAAFLDLLLCANCLGQMGSLFEDPVFPVVMAVLIEPLVLSYHSVLNLTHSSSHFLDAKDESVWRITRCAIEVIVVVSTERC